ncbi:MAG: hypothetical protein HFG33_01565 [Bacilli bacterium]|nr:hypothetical protein [Bacilli bacterium]
MGLSSEELDIIAALILINKKTYSLYRALEAGEDSKTLIPEIEANLKLELDLYELLSLTADKVKAIEKYVETTFPIEINDKLLIGTSPMLNENTYPYYRLIARARYMLKSDSKRESDVVFNAYLDVRVEILYKCLLETAKKARCGEQLTEYGHLILIDSPEVEKRALKNLLCPFASIDDFTSFAVGLEMISIVKKVFPDSPIQSAKNDSHIIYSTHFSEIYQEIEKLLIKQIRLEKELDDRNSTFLLCICQLQAALSLLRSRERKKIYEELLNMKYLTSKMDKDALKGAFEYVEKSLVPIINVYALGQPYKKF